jgi:hypothetical protein
MNRVCFASLHCFQFRPERDVLKQLSCRDLSILTMSLMLLGMLPAGALEYGIAGSAEQQQQLKQSLSSCPSLAVTLDRLAKDGAFTGIRVETSEQTHRAGPFQAAVSGKEIVLTAQWLAAQSQPYFDVRIQNEILPDNLCFGLGHLADHLAHPTAPPSGSASMQEWLNAKLASEASAFIKGWSYVREAALAKNGGKSFTVAQSGSLMLNLRYRFAFIKAWDKGANPRLVILPDASIPPDRNNISAIVEALKTSTIADLQ